MKRTLIPLALLVLVLGVLLPAPARADWFGAQLQGHTGWQQTNRTGHPTVGAAASVTVLGFEAFADLRFLRGDGLGDDRGMFNQLGLRWTMGVPLPAVDLEAYLGASYLFSEVARVDQDLADMGNERDRWLGINPHLGGRLDFPLVRDHISLGLQAEVGYHFLLPNDLTYSTGLNYAAFLDLQFGV